MPIPSKEDLYYPGNDYRPNRPGESYDVRRARSRAVEYAENARSLGCHNCRRGNGRPTYISVHTKHLKPETLNCYGLPWEYHRHKDNQIVIKKYIDHEFQQELFAHSHGFKMAEKLAKITISAQGRADDSADSLRRRDYQSSRSSSPGSKRSPCVSGGSVVSEAARGRRSRSRSANVSASRIDSINFPVRSVVDYNQSISPPKSKVSIERHRNSRRRATHSPAADADLSPPPFDTGVSFRKRGHEPKIERALLRLAEDYLIQSHLLNDGDIIENGRKLLQEVRRGARYREAARIKRELRESNATRQRHEREQHLEYHGAPAMGSQSARRRRRRQAREDQGKGKAKADLSEDEIASYAKFEAATLDEGEGRIAFVEPEEGVASSPTPDETLVLTPSVDTEQQSLMEVKSEKST